MTRPSPQLEPETGRLLTIGEVSQQYRISSATQYRMFANGTLKSAITLNRPSACGSHHMRSRPSWSATCWTRPTSMRSLRAWRLWPPSIGRAPT